jgi:hypothetical protein
MKRVPAVLMMFTATAAIAQNPQSQAPLYAANAKYVNGVAPGYAPTQGSGLTMNLGPGGANCSGTITSYVGGSLTLTANTTNYIYLNTSSGCVPAVKTSAFSATDIPLATVITGASTITSVMDDRTIFNASTGGNATGIQGYQVAATAPTSGQTLIYNGTQYVPGTITAAAAGTTGQLQAKGSSGLLAAATPANIYTSSTDAQNNLLLTNPLVVGTLPNGYLGAIAIGLNAANKLGSNPSALATEAGVYIGYDVVPNMQSDESSVFIGASSGANYVGQPTQTAENGNNTCVGPSTCVTDPTVNEIVAIGNKADDAGTGNNNAVMIGTHVEWNGGASNVLVGSSIGWNEGGSLGTAEQGLGDTLVGDNILNNAAGGTVGTMTNSTVVGHYSCISCWNANAIITVGSYSGSNLGMTTTGTTALNDDIVGNYAGTGLTTGVQDVFVGDYTGYNSGTTVTDTTLIGFKAGLSNLSDDNTYVGALAGQYFQGTGNTIVGYAAGGNRNGGDTGIDNTLVGMDAGNISSGSGDTYLGYGVYSNGFAAAASDNVAIGLNAGALDTTSDNVFIGATTMANAGGGGNVVVGYATGGQSGASAMVNSVIIGNSSSCRNCTASVVIGYGASVGYQNNYPTGAVQLGTGLNNVSNTIQFQNWNFMNATGDATFHTATISAAPAAGNNSTLVPTTAWVDTALAAQVVKIRAGTATISASTTATVTFTTALSVAPTSCALNPSASSATTGQPFATAFTTTGFTANVPVSGTLAMTYQCVVNNAN